MFYLWEKVLSVLRRVCCFKDPPDIYCGSLFGIPFSTFEHCRKICWTSKSHFVIWWASNLFLFLRDNFFCPLKWSQSEIKSCITSHSFQLCDYLSATLQTIPLSECLRHQNIQNYITDYGEFIANIGSTCTFMTWYGASLLTFTTYTNLKVDNLDSWETMEGNINAFFNATHLAH